MVVAAAAEAVDFIFRSIGRTTTADAAAGRKRQTDSIIISPRGAHTLHTQAHTARIRRLLGNRIAVRLSPSDYRYICTALTSREIGTYYRSYLLMHVDIRACTHPIYTITSRALHTRACVHACTYVAVYRNV